MSMVPTNVIAGKDVTVVELDFRNPSDDPSHCPRPRRYSSSTATEGCTCCASTTRSEKEQREPNRPTTNP